MGAILMADSKRLIPVGF